MKILQKDWGSANGQAVTLYTLTHENTSVSISNYGALLQSLYVSNRDGAMQDIVLGYDTLAGYQADTMHMGVIPALYVNRIRNGAFEINGQVVQLECHGKPYSQHAGQIHKQVWGAEIMKSELGSGVRFSLTVEDGFEGFPGPMHLAVTYWLTQDGEMLLNYAATTEKDTAINLTNHAYFNLGGEDILSHQLQIKSDAILETDENILTTGKLTSLDQLPAFDFRKSKAIGEAIDQNQPILNIAEGYDVSYVIDQVDPLLMYTPNHTTQKEVYLAAKAYSPISGIEMSLLTSQPCVHFYSGNSMNGTVGKNDRPLNRRTGFCLETQHHANAVNHPHFPSTILRKGECYSELSVYQFKVY